MIVMLLDLDQNIFQVKQIILFQREGLLFFHSYLMLIRQDWLVLTL